MRLNRDQNQPWLTVIEADGRKDILYGSNSEKNSTCSKMEVHLVLKVSKSIPTMDSSFLGLLQ